MSAPGTPTLPGISRRAKAIAAAQRVQHVTALDLAAQEQGFRNYKHARNTLARSSSVPPITPHPLPVTAQEFPFRDRREFHADSLRRWIGGVRRVNPDAAASMTWRSPRRIIEVLRPFLGTNNNHAHLHTGGGMDITGAALSREPGCIELHTSSRSAFIVRPASLTLEFIVEAPEESFLMLELGKLERTGLLDEHGTPSDTRLRGSEELLELSPGDYVHRRYWDDDVRPDGTPLSGDSRLVTRWMNGKFLFVAKGSRWNAAPSTYEGLHGRFTAGEIRQIVSRSLGRPSPN